MTTSVQSSQSTSIIEAQREHSKSKSTNLGRTFSLLPKDVSAHLSIMDKMMLKIAYELNIDYGIFLQQTKEDKIVGKLFKVVNKLSGMITNLEQATTFYNKMGLESQAEETIDTSQLLLTEFDHQLTNQIQSTLKAFGVKSHDELKEKQKHIQSVKEEASKQFLRNPQQIKLLLQNDELQTKAAKGLLNQKDKNIIYRFWDLIERQENGYLLFEKNEKKFAELFMDLIASHSENFMENLPQLSKKLEEKFGTGGSKAKLAEHYGDLLNLAVQNKHSELLKEIEEANEIEKIQLEYLMLQSELYLPALLKKTIQQFVGKIAEEHEDHVLFMKERWLIPVTKGTIEQEKENIKSPPYDKYAQEDRLKGDEEGALEWEKESEKYRSFHTEILNDSLQKLENIDAFSHSIFGDPKEIRKFIPTLTYYEQKLCAFLNFQTNINSAENYVDPELKSEKSVLSKEYYFQKMMVDVKNKHSFLENVISKIQLM